MERNISVPKEDSFPGKEKCRKLREIRRLIAEVNDIPFEPAVCHHQGPCAGTCPVCDAEIIYLDSKLEERQRNGEKVILSGLLTEDIKKSLFDTPSKSRDIWQPETELPEGFFSEGGDIAMSDLIDSDKGEKSGEKELQLEELGGVMRRPGEGILDNE